ncbi:MAG: hypothetical protein NXY57DRAFT_970344 [Lentinula lateritia]|nr:MAG: hypothetical protein NXY57DRAFT_970344 [Lentinula lateritia]
MAAPPKCNLAWTAQKISLQFGSAFSNLYIVVVVIPSLYVRNEIFFIFTTRRQANQAMLALSVSEISNPI